ncbi:MAG: hypothetical protein HYT15_03380 [Candidatus Magasanikbacteria bacterium]|nr:hypothetical protein [Candidatus Magasanikbacteria bacterium]
MAFYKIKPITVLSQKGTGQLAQSVVDRAIITVLYAAGILEEYDRLFNSTVGNYVFQKTNFNPRPHISKARRESIVAGHLNASSLLYSIKDDASRSKEERYDVTLVTEPLHWHNDSSRSVGGVGLENYGAVVTYSEVKQLLRPVNGEDNRTAEENEDSISSLYLLMLTMHELGHIFGLFPYSGPANASDEDLKQAHCQNECVMYWTFNEEMLKKIRGWPFCPSCLAKLKEFFLKP